MAKTRIWVESFRFLDQIFVDFLKAKRSRNFWTNYYKNGHCVLLLILVQAFFGSSCTNQRRKEPASKE